MRLTRRGRAAPETAALLGLARGGDPVALAVLRADLSPATVSALADLLGVAAPPSDVPVAAAVIAAARQAVVRPTRRDAVVRMLIDGERLSAGRVAELLDLPPAQVQEARAEALARAGLGPGVAACRAWVLVGRADRVTAAERTAAQAHLSSCRSCRALTRASASAR